MNDVMTRSHITTTTYVMTNTDRVRFHEDRIHQTNGTADSSLPVFVIAAAKQEERYLAVHVTHVHQTEDDVLCIRLKYVSVQTGTKSDRAQQHNVGKIWNEMCDAPEANVRKIKNTGMRNNM